MVSALAQIRQSCALLFASHAARVPQQQTLSNQRLPARSPLAWRKRGESGKLQVGAGSVTHCARSPFVGNGGAG